MAYADAYPNYAVGARPGFNHSPSKAFDQVLSDATWIIPVARGYDLIHDLPSITPEERKHIETDFLGCVGRLIIGNHAMIEAPTNWSAISTAAVLIIGYAIDDQQFIQTALYGIKGTPEKPTGGLYDRHFGPKAIDADGMWSEGAMGYQFMALQALICRRRDPLAPRHRHVPLSRCGAQAPLRLAVAVRLSQPEDAGHS